jgi:protein SCO1/2
MKRAVNQAVKECETFGRCLMVAAVFAVLLWGGEVRAAGEQRHPAFGLVLKVDDPHRFEVSCKEIPGFMESMVMTLDVRDGDDLKSIRPGTLVDFTLVVDAKSDYAEKIRVHQFQSPDQRALDVRMLELVDGAFDAKPDVGQMLAVDQRVPEFNLIDQYGRHVKFSDWSGKVVAISFVYTKCSFSEYCFRLSNNLGLIAKRFPDRMGKDLILLTVTFDPATDNPEALSRYAQNWKSSGKGWYFLTGAPQEVKRVCLMFGMNFWPDMGMLAHTMHTAVIDRQGHLVTNLEGNEFSADQLGNLLESMMDRKTLASKN